MPGQRDIASAERQKPAYTCICETDKWVEMPNGLRYPVWTQVLYAWTPVLYVWTPVPIGVREGTNGTSWEVLGRRTQNGVGLKTSGGLKA